MPEIEKNLEIPNIKGDEILEISLGILQKMGAKNTRKELKSESPFFVAISTSFSSIWGWGGMQMEISIREEVNMIILKIKGYIAQVYTGPITKKIDIFLKEMVSILEKDKSVKLNFKPTKPFELQKAKWTQEDSRVAEKLIKGEERDLDFRPIEDEDSKK